MEQPREVWTLNDANRGHCYASQVGTPVDHTVWHARDFLEKRCGILDVNKPRVQVVEQAPTVSVTVTTAQRPEYSDKNFLRSLQQVRQAVVQAILDYPGGPVKWMHDHPGAHARLIQKLVGGQLDSRAESTVRIDIPWVTRERLAYRFEDQKVIDVRPAFDRTLVDDIDPSDPEALPLAMP